MPQSPCLTRPQPSKEPLPQTTAWLQKGCNKANQKGPKVHSEPCIYPRHADKTFTCKLSNQHDCMKQILLDMDYVQSWGAQLPRSPNRDCQNGLSAVAISFDRLTPSSRIRPRVILWDCVKKTLKLTCLRARLRATSKGHPTHHKCFHWELNRSRWNTAERATQLWWCSSNAPEQELWNILEASRWPRMSCTTKRLKPNQPRAGPFSTCHW